MPHSQASAHLGAFRVIQFTTAALFVAAPYVACTVDGPLESTSEQMRPSILERSRRSRKKEK